MKNINITIYTSPNCPYSKRLKIFLYKHGIPFTEIDASKGINEAKQLQEVEKDLRTPIIKISQDDKDELLVGWNDETKNRILQLPNS